MKNLDIIQINKLKGNESSILVLLSKVARISEHFFVNSLSLKQQSGLNGFSNNTKIAYIQAPAFGFKCLSLMVKAFDISCNICTFAACEYCVISENVGGALSMHSNKSSYLNLSFPGAVFSVLFTKFLNWIKLSRALSCHSLVG